MDLCWTLGISFGEDPPLFSKPPGWTPPPPTPRPPAPQPPPPAAHQPFHNPMNAPPGAANSYSQQPRPPQGGNPYAQPPRPAPGGDPYAADPYANPIAFHNPYAAQPGPPPRPAAAPNPYATAQPPPPPAPQPPRPPPPPPQQQQQLNPAELAFRKAAITSLTERLKVQLPPPRNYLLPFLQLRTSKQCVALCTIHKCTLRSLIELQDPEGRM